MLRNPMNRPDAVIFDFDGVLFETEPVHHVAFARAVAPYDIRLTVDRYSELYVGLNDREIFARLQAAHPALEHVSLTAFLAEKNQAYLELTRDGCAPIEGVVALLSRLRRAGTPCAICSGSRGAEIDRLLDSAGLAAFFEAIVSADDVERSKPDPQGYQMVLEELRQARPAIRAGRTIAIEDSDAGIRAAAAAGLRVIALRKPYFERVAQRGIDEFRAFDELTDERIAESL